jgi:hypothetical protein
MKNLLTGSLAQPIAVLAVAASLAAFLGGIGWH